MTRFGSESVWNDIAHFRVAPEADELGLQPAGVVGFGEQGDPYVEVTGLDLRAEAIARLTFRTPLVGELELDSARLDVDLNGWRIDARSRIEMSELLRGRRWLRQKLEDQAPSGVVTWIPDQRPESYLNMVQARRTPNGQNGAL